MTLRSIVSMLAALLLAVPLADAAPSPPVAGGVVQTSDAGDAFERYVRNHAEWQNPDAFMRFLRNHPNGYASDRVHPDGLANVAARVPRGGLADAGSDVAGGVVQTSDAGDAFERYVRNHAEWQNPDAFMRFLRNHPNGYASDRVHPDGFANVAARVPRGGLADAGSDVAGGTGWRELALGVTVGIALGLLGALTASAVRGRRLAHS